MTSWTVHLRSQTGLLVGSVWDPEAGVHVASASLATRQGQRQALLPGSSIRGVLREALRRFAGARTEMTCTWRPGAALEGAPQCRCITCRLFGVPNRPGKLRVSSARSNRTVWLVQAGVAIDRVTRTVSRGSPHDTDRQGVGRRGGALWTERRAVASFDIEVEALDELEPSERELLEAFWAWLEATGLSVGRRKSAGAGSFSVQVTEHGNNARVPVVLLRRKGEIVPRRRYACRITLCEPAHLVGPRQRDFYRDALEVIPGATLRGAIGWALKLRGASELARELFFSDRPVLVGPAFSVPDGTPLGNGVPWASRSRCRSGRHELDLALHELAISLGHSGLQVVCPLCGEPLKPAGAYRPQPIVLGHTAIDPTTRRAAEGQLHYQVAIAPGATFEARILATPDQADVIRSLGEVFVGGRRARGMGRAWLELEELGTPTPDEVTTHAKAVGNALRRLGVEPSGPMALLGIESDADPGEPVESVLRRRGLKALAGEIRRVERGGWDELNSVPRVLRTVVAAGSWVAVTWDGVSGPDAVAALVGEGVPDPQEICPLIVGLREPTEEVTGVPETTRSTLSDRMVERDRLVREVREFCRRCRDQLPARAQLHNLLRYAQQTDAVEEVALFFEYQASRGELRRARHFLLELARIARDSYGGDPQGLRDYLAIVVRAAQVERPEPGARGADG